MRALVETWGAATWPLHQCFFGADNAKPTRLATNLPSALHHGQCWHVLALDGSYLGPLMHCPHAHSKPLLGLEKSAWRTSASAAYPPMFCDFIARMLMSALEEPRSVAQGMDSTSVHPAEALAEALLRSCQDPLQKTYQPFSLCFPAPGHMQPQGSPRRAARSLPAQIGSQQAWCCARTPGNSRRPAPLFAVSYPALMLATTLGPLLFLKTCSARRTETARMHPSPTWWWPFPTSKVARFGTRMRPETSAGRCIVGSSQVNSCLCRTAQFEFSREIVSIRLSPGQGVV